LGFKVFLTQNKCTDSKGCIDSCECDLQDQNTIQLKRKRITNVSCFGGNDGSNFNHCNLVVIAYTYCMDGEVITTAKRYLIYQVKASYMVTLTEL